MYGTLALLEAPSSSKLESCLEMSMGNINIEKYDLLGDGYCVVAIVFNHERPSFCSTRERDKNCGAVDFDIAADELDWFLLSSRIAESKMDRTNIFNFDRRGPKKKSLNGGPKISKLFKPLRIQASKCNREQSLLPCTHEMKRAAFARFDDGAFSWSHSMLTERKGFGQVVFDQKSRCESDDLRKLILSKSFAPRNTDVNLVCFLPLRGDD